MTVLFCVRSGHININNGRLRNAGNAGYGWSSRADSSASNGYFLNFNASGVNPSNSNARWHGFPIRCLSARRVPILSLNKAFTPINRGKRLIYFVSKVMSKYGEAAVNFLESAEKVARFLYEQGSQYCYAIPEVPKAVIEAAEKDIDYIL